MKYYDYFYNLKFILSEYKIKYYFIKSNNKRGLSLSLSLCVVFDDDIIQCRERERN